jgi:hypothetical protein
MSNHPGDTSEAIPAIILGDDIPADDAPPIVPHESQAEMQRLRCHRQMLGMACAVIALSLLLLVRSDDHAAFRFLPDWPIPVSCPSQAIFGVDCPGCGLTRSFVFLAHGDWQHAWEKHRLGWLLALAVAIQIPYRLAAMLGRNPRPLGTRIPYLFSMALIAALIGNWVLRVFGV